MMKIIFIHGNGSCTADMHWYPSAEEKFKQAGLETVRQTLPDNEIAHGDVWVPHIRKQLGADENSILIGHSSGAIAALRYAEQYPIRGSIIVSGYHTDLGMEDERAGGWFDRPWNWQNIKQNQQWILQFASEDDPWIPIHEPRFIHQQINSDYHELPNRGHFIGPSETTRFPELEQALFNKLDIII